MELIYKTLTSEDAIKAWIHYYDLGPGYFADLLINHYTTLQHPKVPPSKLFCEKQHYICHPEEIKHKVISNFVAKHLTDNVIEGQDPDIYKRALGKIHEEYLQKCLREENIPFISEKECKKYDLSKTPDILLTLPFAVNREKHKNLQLFSPLSLEYLEEKMKTHHDGDVIDYPIPPDPIIDRLNFIKERRDDLQNTHETDLNQANFNSFPSIHSMNPVQSSSKVFSLQLTTADATENAENCNNQRCISHEMKNGFEHSNYALSFSNSPPLSPECASQISSPSPSPFSPAIGYSCSSTSFDSLSCSFSPSHSPSPFFSNTIDNFSFPSTSNSPETNYDLQKINQTHQENSLSNHFQTQTSPSSSSSSALASTASSSSSSSSSSFVGGKQSSENKFDCLTDVIHSPSLYLEYRTRKAEKKAQKILHSMKLEEVIAERKELEEFLWGRSAIESECIEKDEASDSLSDDCDDWLFNRRICIRKNEQMKSNLKTDTDADSDTYDIESGCIPPPTAAYCHNFRKHPHSWTPDCPYHSLDVQTDCIHCEQPSISSSSMPFPYYAEYLAKKYSSSLLPLRQSELLLRWSIYPVGYPRFTETFPFFVDVYQQLLLEETLITRRMMRKEHKIKERSLHRRLTAEEKAILIEDMRKRSESRFEYKRDEATHLTDSLTERKCGGESLFGMRQSPFLFKNYSFVFA
ncbi:uncharacterized protein MONOS_7731 [Monocercomonoides exilis]|uniref:uncharacterized protein n=1 Tax=Monocercomonoides exilis TaxID=2049356 RepID=UPI00355940B0|nr:hypothetical protein MONOS_7731 [Monocercomonoides exilis]|eukprot:MONOS_7731.1-p1 / transcript=MONOS_7731.1 / gene=MONOS_7731 / organism=Monocercomonoides_exilis_PA203 / gene_product=unspecified product / transcript_product=unspecified product / location=Mono_scaffold00272:28705-30783(-) / protein_length=692 / sequence_SO=supercontig / SO=protein_coding / is_pseudo=false